jgi:O-antigen/teichoic acid export membrane protein
LFLTRVSGAIFSGLTLYYLTRILSSVEYGKFSILTTSASLISVVLFQWISVVVSRYLTLNPVYIINFAYRNFFSIAVFAVFFSLLIVYLFSRFDYFLIVISGISLGLFTLKSQVSNSLENFRSYNLLMITKYIVSFIVAIFFAKIFKRGDLTIISFVIGGIIPVIFFNNRNAKYEVKNQINDNLYSFGIPFVLISVSTIIIDFSDRYVIKYFFGFEILAHYSANYDLTQQLIGGTLSVFSLYFMPKIVALRNNNDFDSEYNLKTNYLHFSFLLGSIIVFNFIIFYDLISNIMSVDYRYSGIYEILFISTGVFLGNIKGTIFDLELQMQGKVRILIWNILFMSILNIFLNFLLVPQYQQLGAAISTFLSFSFGLVSSIFFTNDKFKLNSSFVINILKIILVSFSLLYLNSIIKVDGFTYNFLVKIFLDLIFFTLIIGFNTFNVQSFIVRFIKLSTK